MNMSLNSEREENDNHSQEDATKRLLHESTHLIFTQTQ